MRRALRQLLEDEADLTVIAEAESAESALAQLPTVAPDLLLTDLSLPGASGLELVEMLKRHHPELRCLVVTGHADPFYRAAALAAGAVGFVTKDDPDEVIGAVRRVLNGN
jgi:DNA-binding NarL/FixJ family response regulator